MYKPGRSGNKSEVWGIPEVLDHFGIERVDQVIDILGLMGDTADNVPGCSGIGPKSAATLVYKYGDIDGIYAHIDELKGKQRQNLLDCQPTVHLSRTLVTICTEVTYRCKNSGSYFQRTGTLFIGKTGIEYRYRRRYLREIVGHQSQLYRPFPRSGFFTAKTGRSRSLCFICCFQKRDSV